jgi:CubicO group peptidase (beta-lactamase class C family)
MMKRFLSAAMLLLGAVWLSACEPPPSPETPPALSGELRQRLDQFVTERMLRGHVPGLSLVVVKDGEPVYVKGYGSENLETGQPMTEHSLVSLGSTTKAMTALALMQLVEQGLVDVEAPVTRYLPWFQTADGQGGAILVKHLLSHSSGLPASFVWDGATDDGALERRGRALANVHLRFTPGAGWEYANDGFAVLGLIVQAVSGMPYEDYMALHVFQPLGLEHTTFGALPARQGALSQGYVWTRGEVRPVPAVMSRAQHPAGTALFSSAEDVARYLVMMVGKGQGSSARVLSTESVEHM